MLNLRLKNGTEIKEFEDHTEEINTQNMLRTIFGGGAVYYTGNYEDDEAYNLITCPEDAECDDYERIIEAKWTNRPGNSFIDYVSNDMNKLGIDTVLEIYKLGILEHGHDLMWEGNCYNMLSKHMKGIEQIIPMIEAEFGTDHILRQCFDDGFNFPNMVQMCYEFVLSEHLYRIALEDL